MKRKMQLLSLMVLSVLTSSCDIPFVRKTGITLVSLSQYVWQSSDPVIIYCADWSGVTSASTYSDYSSSSDPNFGWTYINGKYVKLSVGAIGGTARQSFSLLPANSQVQDTWCEWFIGVGTLADSDKEDYDKKYVIAVDTWRDVTHYDNQEQYNKDNYSSSNKSSKPLPYSNIIFYGRKK